MVNDIQLIAISLVKRIQEEITYIDNMVKFVNENTDIKVWNEDDEWGILYESGKHSLYVFDIKEIAENNFKKIYTNDLSSLASRESQEQNFYDFRNELMDLYDKAFLRQKLNNKYKIKNIKTQEIKI